MSGGEIYAPEDETLFVTRAVVREHEIALEVVCHVGIHFGVIHADAPSVSLPSRSRRASRSIWRAR